MNRLEVIMDYSLFNFSVVRWLMVFLIILATVFVLGAVKRLVLKRINTWSKAENLRWLNYVEALFGKTKVFLYLAIGLFVGITVFDIRDQLTDKGYTAAQILLIVQVGVWANALVTVLIDRYKLEVEDDEAQLTALTAIDFLIGLAVWSVVFLMILANLGIDITALVASLGIGGVALALAAQKILGDLFAFFSIIVDKPFVRNDFIIVDDFMGTIEHIGIKSTRIRSLGGEQLIFSNQDLLQSRIRNYKRMQQRRVVFEFGVPYDTDYEDLEIIPDIIEEFIDDDDLARFDRTHLKEFGESTLKFEVVYWLLSADFTTHMDVKQTLLMAMIDEFRARGIEFAFPTQTVFLQDSDTRQTQSSPSEEHVAA